MRGTEKQRAWAKDIKERRIGDLVKLEELPIPDGHPAKNALKEIHSKYYAPEAIDAAWWIAHDQSALQVKELANEIAKGKDVHWPEDTSEGWQ